MMRMLVYSFRQGSVQWGSWVCLFGDAAGLPPPRYLTLTDMQASLTTQRAERADSSPAQEATLMRH